MNSTDTPKKLKVIMFDPQSRHLAWSNEVAQSDVNWDFVRIDSAESLLRQLSEQHYDVVMVHCSERPQVDLQLMRNLADIQPATIRVFLGAQFWKESLLAKAVDCAHRIFKEDISVPQLDEIFSYLVKITKLISRSSLRDFIGKVGCLPTPPVVYQELTTALNSDISDAEQISHIIEKDPAVAAQVLKQVNSAFFGFNRKISNLQEAVTVLGLRNLRGLALTSQLSNQFKQNAKWSHFSFEQLNQRALMVGRFAQDICRKKGMDQVAQDHAFIAGLLHDLGILIMASHDPVQYHKLMNYAVKNSKPIYLVEKTAFGFFHGEVAAALLAMWGLAPQVVEAVMLHHVPHLSGGNDFTPLTAVHMADSLIPSIDTKGDCDLASSLSVRYLDRVGMLDEISNWQLTANEYRIRLAANG